MITKKTRYEIEEQFKETFGDEWMYPFTNTEDVLSKSIHNAYPDEEYYTDGEHYVNVDDLDEYIDGNKAWQWAIAEDEWQDIYDSLKATLEKAVRLCEGVEFTTDDIAECYKEKAKENADLFLEWLWGQE